MASLDLRRIANGNPARLFLILAIGSLISVGLLAPRVFPLLTGSYYDRGLLAFVHLNTLGIIASAIVASSFQVMPCALGVPLEAGRRAGPAMFLLHFSGILIFLIGFHQTWHPILATGGGLLVAGLTLYIVMIVKALRRAPSLDITGWHTAVSLGGLSVGVLLGFTLAGAKGTWFLGDVTMQVLSAHAVMMLAGWVLVMLNGVAYHMVPMLSGTNRKLWSAPAWIELALVTSGAWLAAGALLFAIGRPWVIAGLSLVAIGEALFLAQMVQLYLPKLCAIPGPQELFVLLAGVTGLGASGLVVVGLINGEPVGSHYWVAAGWLAIGGVALAAIQGLAPTIGSELTGLELNLAERRQRNIARIGWLGWTAGLALAAWATLAMDRDLARLAGFAALAGVGCFAFNLVSALLRSAMPGLLDQLPRSRSPESTTG